MTRAARCAVRILLALFITGVAAFGQAQAWELRLCAEPDNLPFSNREGQGFENRIAEILAEELGAELSYAWLPAPGGRSRDVFMRRGDCDAVMGINDGHEGFLTTLAYYRSPYVFVYREDSGIELASLDDPQLKQLSIGVTGNGGISPGGHALAKRGLIENQVTFPLEGDNAHPLAAPVAAVAEDVVDVALVWGPIGGYFAQTQAVPLELVPVSPLIEMPFVSLVVPMAIGVRPGDEALRDRLNLALTQRWNEVQAVLAEYGMPLEPLPKPTLSATPEPEAVPLRIGVVLPTPTGDIPVSPDGAEIAAEASRKGAILAEEEFGLEVLIGTAPSVAAARRAGERLAAADQVFALVGGLGEGQAQVLGEVAKARDVLFFNIGSPSNELRNEPCRRHTFHVEASTAMYLDALAGWFTGSGFQRWFLVYPDSAAGESLFGQARDVLSAQQSVEVVGAAAVPDAANYVPALDAIREAEPDVVLLLLDWRGQLEFLGFYDALGIEPVLTGLPYPVTQTRSFYLATRDTAQAARALQRAALWEATLELDGAGELNGRFGDRWGLPMDPSAWAAYASVKILAEALDAAGSKETADLVHYLERPTTGFDLHKGTSLSFRAWDHQLRQPVYMVQIDPETKGRFTLSEHLAVAGVVQELPEPYLNELTPGEWLDRSGDGSTRSQCRF